MKVIVSIDWRTAAAGWPGGQLYLLDLSTHTVLDHYVGPLVPTNHLQTPGGWTGFRGVFHRGGYAYVADEAAIRVFRVAGDRLRFSRAWTTRRFYDIHDIYPAEDGEGWWLSVTNTDEVVKVWPYAGNPFLLNRGEGWGATVDPQFVAFDNAQRVANRTGPRRVHDNFHINSVVEQGDQLWTYSHVVGCPIRIRPGPTYIHPLRVRCGHSIRMTPKGDLMLLNTTAEELLVVPPDDPRPRVRVKCGAARLDERINPNTGKAAKSGWLRGLAVLDEQMCVCGTSPAQLFVVNYRTGVVEDYWQLDREDVRASTFGICRVCDAD